MVMSVINRSPVSTEDIVIKDAIDEAMSQFKDPTEMRVSSEGRKHIKSHEGLKLTAYRLGDGMITIGYGHAEPASKSKYKKGQTITKEEADTIFNDDLTKIADGVRRIFSDWKQKGIERRLTQGQFDALVSLAYNMGVVGLRRTDLIQKIKDGDLDEAGEIIKTTKINDKKFPGLRKRRSKESEMFTSHLKKQNADKV
jgi:GH24 family phage-related lysozyme (muramidase)